MNSPIEIGKRLEVFWDDTMIDHENTGTTYRLHEPVQREKVLTEDDPWGGDHGEFTVVIQDGDVYRMYCLVHGRMLYHESKDGIHWNKPIIGEYEFNGSKENNILNILDKEGKTIGIDGFRPFIDTNPDCLPGERIKAAANLERGGDCKIVMFVSPDGIHFREKLTLDIREGSSFDSVNTVFYNPVKKKYEAYLRYFHSGSEVEHHGMKRGIRTAECETLEGRWSTTKELSYMPDADWQLYTNGVMLYPGADHIYIGFPLRFISWGKTLTDKFTDLCGYDARVDRLTNKKHKYESSTAITDTLFMTSRDGLHWNRYADAFLTPGPEHPTNWIYYSVCIHGIVETPSLHPGCDNELSFYCAENRWTDTIPADIYRYSIRKDGFVSQRAPWYGTSMKTKRFIFDGSEMFINFSTSVYGGVKVIIRDDDGNQISSVEMIGDSTKRKVRFNEGNLADFAGKPVTATFEMRDADLYSMKFN